MKFFVTLFCFCVLAYSSERAAANVRPGKVPEKCTLHGTFESVLFQRCVEEDLKVEGIPNSIVVSKDEEFVRFVPKTKIELEWTVVDLGNAFGIIECSRKAFELRAYMFKFDGGICSIAADGYYDLKSEQEYDGADAEAVYITTRQYTGCQFGTPDGMTYGEGGRLVSELEMPLPATCCAPTDKGGCLINDSVKNRLTYCEAVAYCKAKGVPLASKKFFEEFVGEELGRPGGIAYPWLNIRKIEGVWLWMPEMVPVSESSFLRSPNEDDFCASLKLETTYGNESIVPDLCEYHSNTVICYDDTSALPHCPQT